MTAQARRLPRTLKKKLEASLESLTPREAGRLFLIYMQEADRKNIPGGQDYPPAEELFAAWQRRTEAKRKDVEAYNREIALSNGFMYLTGVAVFANYWADKTLWRYFFLVSEVRRKLTALLYQDAVSNIARMIHGQVRHFVPNPVSWEDYRLIVDWSETAALQSLDDLAQEMTDTWAEAQGFGTLEVPDDFSRAHEAEAKQTASSLIQFYQDIRRLWAAEQGERLLTEVFKGDQAALDYWVKGGDWAGPGLTEAFFDAKTAAYHDRLVAMAQAGDLEGGLGFSTTELYNAVLICDGKLPAWAALRVIWPKWLADRHIFQRYETTPDPQALNGLHTIYDINGDLEGDDLVGIVKGFVKDVRARPWGGALPKKVDFDALARLLIEEPHPLTAARAPDLGLVDWEAFRSREGDEGDVWELSWYATVRSLRAKAADLGLGPDHVAFSWVKEFYYPTDDPEDKRRGLARIESQLRAIQTSQRSFTYREEPREDMLTLEEFLGVEFTTPLEQTVGQLGEAFGAVVTFRRTLDIIADEYFGGLPILVDSNAERVDWLEAILNDAEETLNDWLQKLENPIFNIQTETLHLVKEEADEAVARRDVEEIVALAKMPSRGRNIDIDLGEEDPKPPPPPAKTTRPAKKTPARKGAK